MDLVKLKWEVPKGEDGAHLTAISDIHKGNRFHDEKTWNINRDWLYDHKEHHLLLLGDLIECSSKHTLGLEDQVMEVDEQIDLIEKDFLPFAEEGRIIGMIIGNHEERAKRHASVDVVKTIAKYLDVPYFGAAQVLYLRARNEGKKRGQNYTIYAKHGSSFARQAGGKINAVMRMRDIVKADLYLHAHMHDLMHEVQDVYEVDRGSMRLHRKHFVVTGGYLKYGGYVEKKGYAPTGPSGSARIKFHSDEHRITVKI